MAGKHLSVERKKYVSIRAISAKYNKKIWKTSSSSDGDTYNPPACKFLKLKHHINSSYEKSNIERIIRYIKDRTENSDDYFQCNKNKCKLKHVVNWFHLFVDYYNKEVICLS